MNWINLRTETLRSPNFANAKQGAIETWLRVLAYCCEQENGGCISDGVSWNDRGWMMTCGVTKAEIQNASPLLYDDGLAILVEGYPNEKEAEVKAKRESGKKGGKRSASLRAQSIASSCASTEGEGNSNGKEKVNGMESKTKEVKKRALLASEGAIFAADFPETHKPSLALWWDHKREKGQSYKPTGWKTLCTQQARKSADQVLRDVEFSIANNYAGIFADKQSASEIKAPERYFYEHPDIHSIPTFAEELREAFIENHDITDPKYQKIIATFDRRVVETAREL